MIKLEVLLKVQATTAEIVRVLDLKCSFTDGHLVENWSATQIMIQVGKGEKCREIYFDKKSGNLLLIRRHDTSEQVILPA